MAYVSYPDGALWRSKADGSDPLQLSYSSDYAFMPRWSPDDKEILFWETPVGKPSRIYEVSANGGSPRQLLPNDPSPQQDPNWSPDGSKIVFAGNSNDPASAIRILDLKTGKVSTLPGSQGFFSPRWSPDGRYIPAFSRDAKDPFHVRPANTEMDSTYDGNVWLAELVERRKVPDCCR